MGALAIDDAFRQRLAQALRPIQARLITGRGHGPVVTIGDALVTIDPHGDSPYPSANRNRAQFLGCGVAFDPALVGGVVTDLLARFRAAGVPRFVVWLSHSPHLATITTALRAHGCRPIKGAGYPTLVRDCAPLAPPATAFSARLVDASAVAALRPALETVFGSADAAAQFIGCAAQPGSHAALAFAGATPVAAALLTVDGRLGYLGSAATAPEHRGRGAHGALIATRIAHAAALGCDTVAVETLYLLKPSLRNLLRHGFTVAYDKQLLEWRDPALAKPLTKAKPARKRG